MYTLFKNNKQKKPNNFIIVKNLHFLTNAKSVKCATDHECIHTFAVNKNYDFTGHVSFARV